MSKKRKSRTVPSRCIVIDASIARAAGSFESVHPTGIRCREFLMTVRNVCHRMAWTKAIQSEWEKHQSVFAMQWVVSMQSLRKLRTDLDESEMSDLRQTIAERSESESVAAIVLKDCLLLEAAIHSDQRVASLDDVVRSHLQSLAVATQVVWINPTNDDEEPIAWLEAGAPSEPKRLLK